jgi:hypothetical protein
LATIETTNLAIIYATENGIETTLERIEREAREQAAALDISTEKNRRAIKSLAHKVARSKTALDDAGADVKAEWKRRTDAIDAQRRSVRSRLDSLKAEILTPVEAYEAAIQAKIDANNQAIAEMEALAERLSDLTPADINERRAALKSLAAFDWLPEFAAKAERVRAGVGAQLLVGLQEATQREIEAEAERQRQAEEAEQKRVAAIEARRIREEQIAAEAAEKARLAAEAKAAREAEETRQAALRAQQEAERKAQAERDAAAQRERDAAEAVRRAEAARAAAEERAEREKKEAAEAAERKLAAELAAERKRVADEREREAEATRKREANVAHRKRINGEALADVLAAIQTVMPLIAGSAEEPAQQIAKVVVMAIAKGLVRHISIGY